jgi:predicted transcriptional regulator
LNTKSYTRTSREGDEDKLKKAIKVADIMRSISSTSSLLLFNSIAIADGKSDLLISKLNLTRKQFYSKMSYLMKCGLVNRRNGKYILTSFGKVIYNYKLEIETVLNYQWKLEALDSILLSQSSSAAHNKPIIPLEEKANLVDKLIDNNKIKEIVFPVINNNNNNDATIMAAATSSSSTGNKDNRYYHSSRQEREQEVPYAYTV